MRATAELAARAGTDGIEPAIQARLPYEEGGACMQLGQEGEQSASF